MMKQANTLIVVALLAVPAQGEEFQSQPAKDAKKKYEAAIAAAQKQYLEELSEAAKKSADGGDLDEVVRIKEAREAFTEDVNPQQLSEEQMKLNKARKRIEGTKWKWKPEGTFTIRSEFLENRRVKHVSSQGQPPHYGAWDMLDERTLVMRRRPEGLWVFFFEEDYQSFRVMQLAPVEYKGTIGEPIK